LLTKEAWRLGPHSSQSCPLHLICSTAIKWQKSLRLQPSLTHSDIRHSTAHGSPVPRVPCLPEQEEATRGGDGAAAGGGEADPAAARADQGAHLREPVPVRRPRGARAQGKGRRQEQRWQHQSPPRLPRWLMRLEGGEIVRRIKMWGCDNPAKKCCSLQRRSFGDGIGVCTSGKMNLYNGRGFRFQTGQ